MDLLEIRFPVSCDFQGCLFDLVAAGTQHSKIALKYSS